MGAEGSDPLRDPADWHVQNFPSGQAKDPRGPAKGQFRVIRGGGYIDTAYALTLGYRGAFGPNGSLNHFGLRVVCEVDEPGQITSTVSSLAEIATRFTKNWSLQEAIKLGPEIDRFLANGDLNESNANHLKSLAAFFGRGADWQRAGKLLDLYLERYPDNYWYWHHRLSVAACIGDMEKYEHCCKAIARLVASQSDDSNANIAAATKFASFDPQSARLDRAHALAKRLEQKWPNDVGSLHARALVLYAEGDTDGCRKLLKQIPIDAGNPFFKIRRLLLDAKCAAKSENQPEAEKALEQAAKLLEPMWSSGDLGHPRCWAVAQSSAELRDAEIAIRGKAVTPPLTPQRLAGLDFDRISSLPATKQVKAVYQELQRRNPEFDGKWWQPTIENGVVTGLHFCTDHITDISPVTALPGLRSLQMHGMPLMGSLVDLSPLKGMKMTVLEIPNNKVVDLTPLRGMPLTYLQLIGCPVTDLTPLKGMPLESLDLRAVNGIDLTQLAGLPLDFLCLSNTQVSDLTLLKGLPLTRLQCYETQVSDLTPLKGMRLKLLHVMHSNVTGLAPIKDMPLEDLTCDFEAERDTPILRKVRTLKKINGKSAAEFWKDLNEQKKKSEDQQPQARSDERPQKMIRATTVMEWLAVEGRYELACAAVS